METKIKMINGRTICDTTAREAVSMALEKAASAGKLTAKIVDDVLVVTDEETEG